ncbi:MAG: hypothetical protein ACHP7D_02920 [Lysobacterales bacterium]
MTALALRDFLLICGLGLVVAGLTAYVITWMLVAVHLRDHHAHEHARLGGFLFAPHAFGWYLGARWRALHDRGLSALAVLGSIGAWAIVVGAIVAIGSKLLAFGTGTA